MNFAGVFLVWFLLSLGVRMGWDGSGLVKGVGKRVVVMG